MRYESTAYGTRAEIEHEIRRGLSANRSERRRAESERALQELLDGDFSITMGHTTYIVEEPAPNQHGGANPGEPGGTEGMQHQP